MCARAAAALASATGAEARVKLRAGLSRALGAGSRFGPAKELRLPTIRITLNLPPVPTARVSVSVSVRISVCVRVSV